MSLTPHRTHQSQRTRESYTAPLYADQPTTQPFALPIPIIYDQAPARPRWEYHVVTMDLREEPPLDDERLAALGAEGWLLAGAIQPPSARETSHTIVYYFVRQA